MSLAALLPPCVAHGGAVCARTDTGGVERLSTGPFRSGGRQFSAPYARPADGIVISDDARGSSFAPVVVKRQMKKETSASLPRARLELRQCKEEDVQPSSPPPKHVPHKHMPAHLPAPIWRPPVEMLLDM
jgi:hypothetical protein